jgi:hypothetical protein
MKWWNGMGDKEFVGLIVAARHLSGVEIETPDQIPFTDTITKIHIM